MAFDPARWHQPGFKVGYAEQDGAPSQEEQLLLQARLARYLNTMLVVRGEDLHVSLSPVKASAGLPEALRATELGRDMLAQDVVLKYRTASLLHPAQDTGKAFWKALEGVAGERREIEACTRVWVVPGDVTVRESMQGGLAHVDIERLSPRVMCEADYETLAVLRGGPSQPVEHDFVLEAFREHVLPRVQEEVSMGSGFGLLRQMLSVLVVAAWFRKSQLEPAMRASGLLDCNDTARFGLNTAGGEVDELYGIYRDLFGQGVWTFAESAYSLNDGTVRRRVLVAGSLQFGRGIDPGRAASEYTARNWALLSGRTGRSRSPDPG